MQGTLPITTCACFQNGSGLNDDVCLISIGGIINFDSCLSGLSGCLGGSRAKKEGPNLEYVSRILKGGSWFT